MTISMTIKNSVKLKDSFETQNYYYIIQNVYDDNLEHFMKIHKRIPINLIQKIFKQLNLTFQDLLNNFLFIVVRPSNILIKYSNPEKTNFDSFLSDYWIASEAYNKKQEEEQKKLNRMRCNMMCGQQFFNNFDSYLYSIGLTIYYLYFGNLPDSTPHSLSGFNELLSYPKDVKVEIKEDKQLENLINGLLRINVNERINWQEYFAHPFFNQYQY